MRTHEQRSGFAEMRSASGDAVKIAEVTTKDLEYCVNSIQTAAAAGLRALTNSERSSIVGNMLSISIT